MRLTEQQTNDLGRLAVDRCERALQSVTQLMDGQQAYFVVVAVACCLIEGAADMLQQGSRNELSDEKAKGHVISEVLDGVGVKWKRSNSPTRSAKKSSDRRKTPRR